MADRAQNVRRGKATGPLAAEAAKAHRIAQAMLADGEKLLNRERLLSHVRSFGLCRNNWPAFHHLQDWYNSSSVGLLQIPSEYVDFLLYCSKYRPSSMVEIGAFTGGSSFIAAAFFKALNPDFRLTAVDLGDYILLEKRTLELLDITICAGKTSDDIFGQAFDIVFIDGDHSHQWAKSDYLNVGRFARKVCGMHDVNGREYIPRNGGVFTFWRKLRHSLCHKLPVLQISHASHKVGEHQDGDWMGIGILDFGYLDDAERAKLINFV
ncbi:MAG: class I SAM-dependent methyltransferase [Pseudomonadota bacterium]